MKMALFKNVKYNFTSPCNESYEELDENIRVSEYVDVIFPPLSNVDIVSKQVDFLKQSKKNKRAKLQSELTIIDSKIGKLLALPQGV